MDLPKKIKINLNPQKTKLCLPENSDGRETVDIHHRQIKFFAENKNKLKFLKKRWLIAAAIFLFLAISLNLTGAPVQNASSIYNINFLDNFYNEKFRQNFEEIFILKEKISADTSEEIKKIFDKNNLGVDLQHSHQDLIVLTLLNHLKRDIENLTEKIKQDLKTNYLITDNFYRQIRITMIKNQPNTNHLKIYFALINDHLIISKKLGDLEKTIDKLISY